MRLALAVALLLLAPAAARAQWRGQTLSSPHSAIDSPSVIVGGDGGALAWWRFQQGLGNGSRAGTEGAVRAPGAAGFGHPFAIVPARSIDRPLTTVAGLEPYGARSAILALILPGPGNPPQSRVGVRFGKLDGRFGRVRTIARAPAYSILRASLAVNARGDAALAWFENRGVRTDRVYVALRRAGHGFGRPRRLATGRIRSVAAAIGERGHALVAWDARGVVRARFKPRGRGFGATETIRSQDAYFADLHAVVTAAGRAVLAWSAQFASEGGERGPAFYQLAARRAGAGRFGEARLLDVVAAPQEARPIDLVPDGAGAAVAWTGTGGRVRVIRHGGPPQDLGPGWLSGLAAGPDGRLVAVWDGGVDDPASVVRAAVAGGPGQPFGAPEDVSAAGRDSHLGAAAFLGVRPLVVLSSREGRGQPVAQAYVR